MANVESRGKGSYRLNVILGYDDKGVPIRERKTVKAKNMTEAKKMLSIFEAEILTGNYIKPENKTLKQLYAEWDENITEDDLAPKTKQNYINILENRILPKYGNMKISDVKPIHVLNFVNSLKKDGARLDGKPGPLSASSINNCYKAFNSVLKFAKTMKWISENPADGITTPTVQQTETEIYEPKELMVLVNNIKNLEFRWEVLIAIALTSSARQGEIAALEEKHVDFKRGGIHIHQALTLKKDIGVALKSTKTKQKRFVSLPNAIMNMLEKLIEIRKEEVSKVGDLRVWKDHLFLFGDVFGKPLRPDSISQWWSRFMESDQFKELGLKKIRFHDLRHSSLTFLSAKGIRAKAVQKRAGHARIGTTFDIYGHTLIEEDREAASQFDEMFE
ncbi:tyrosine-type recombinase/integrase [Bacillus sp. JJ1562]|uniref:tyrosine-type recombinase/integrase n=1 Tax=Bacillus sp. JJ1562 TaxID=3122960 RepID=UPI0030013AB4